MKLKELKARVRVLGSAGYGHKKVEIVYKGKPFTFITTNTLATDRLFECNYVSDRKCSGYYTSPAFGNSPKSYVSDRKCSGYYTLKQAYQALWDEGKSKNGL
jgi:hypothetical protein